MHADKFLPAHIAWYNAVARFGSAAFLALSIGIERFVHKKPVSFRPFVTIALSSCGLGLLATVLPLTSADPNLSADPAKVISGVITAIGFLGAGAVFSEGDAVKGGGSASSIWSSGAIGLICGMGAIWLAGIIALSVWALFLLSRRFADTSSYAVSAPPDEDDGKT